MNTSNKGTHNYKLSTRPEGGAGAATADVDLTTVPGANRVAGIESRAIGMVDKKSGILDRWFPTPESRAKAEGQLALVNTEMEFRQRMLLMLRDSQLQTMRETYDVYLKQLKVEGRGSIAIHIARKLADLQTAMSDQTERVIAELEERHDKLASIKIDAIRAREEERLGQVLDGYYSATKKLVDDFVNIVHEEVKSQ